MGDPFRIFGVPLVGVILPFLGKRRIPLNRDGSFIDGGEEFIENERGFYYVEPWSFEWLGVGWPLSRSLVRRTDTGEVVEPEFDEAGA